MPRSAARNDHAVVVARFLVAALDSGSRIILREGLANPWGAAPPDAFHRLPVGLHSFARILNSLAGITLGDALPSKSGVETAIDVILQHTVTIPAACGLLGSSGTEILALIDRGELGGLCVNGDWFLSRSGAEGLARLADAEKWFRERGLQRYDAP